MTTSGTSAFNLSVLDLIEEAYERCGVEVRSGYDLRTARRSMNLMAMEWANKGINLWTVEQGSVPLVQGTISYDLPADTIDLLDHIVRTGTGNNQSDINISRISLDTYSTIPNKNAQGRPIQVWINRLSGATESGGVAYPTINVWPAPDQSSTYTFVYWRLRRMQDAGNGDTTQDVPFRFLPAMVAGLAYHMSMKIPEALPRVQMLKSVYDELWQAAADEDREKAPLRLAPRVAMY
jgi:hypothetical protein